MWRWTGDNAFRDEMYDFAKSNLRVHLPRARRRRRRLARGPRQRRARPGWARRSSTTRRPRCAACATSRTSRSPRATPRPRRGRATGRRPRGALRARLVDARDPAARRLARRGGQREDPAAPLDRRDADGDRDRARRPGRARAHHRPERQRRAEPAREGLLRRRLRALPHGRARLRPRRSDGPAERTTFTLNTSIMAVGEGNYGRLGADQQRRFTTANRRLAAARLRRAAGRDAGDRPSPDYAPAGSMDRSSPSARWCCRPGATTGPRGPSSTSSWACAPTSAAAALEVVPRCRATSAHRGIRDPPRQAGRGGGRAPRGPARPTRRA